MRILFLATTAALFTTSAFAQGLGTPGPTSSYTHETAVDCSITANTAATDEVINVAAGNSFTMDIECNTEFSLDFRDDNGDSDLDVITMTNEDPVEAVSTDYGQVFTGAVTENSDNALVETSSTAGGIVGEYQAQNGTATFAIAWDLGDLPLEAGNYNGSGTVTLTGEDQFIDSNF